MGASDMDNQVMQAEKEQETKSEKLP